MLIYVKQFKMKCVHVIIFVIQIYDNIKISRMTNNIN